LSAFPTFEARSHVVHPLSTFTPPGTVNPLSLHVFRAGPPSELFETDDRFASQQPERPDPLLAHDSFLPVFQQAHNRSGDGEYSAPFVGQDFIPSADTNIASPTAVTGHSPSFVGQGLIPSDDPNIPSPAAEALIEGPTAEEFDKLYFNDEDWESESRFT
jgi:hypothetical protein